MVPIRHDSNNLGTLQPTSNPFPLWSHHSTSPNTAPNTQLPPLLFDPLIGALGRPRIKCNIISRTNPNLPQVESHSLDWAVKMKLISDTPSARGRFLSYRFSPLAAGSYPNATGDQLKVATDYITWLFALDDICDTPATNGPKNEAGVRMIEGRITQVACGASTESTDHPLVRSYEDIMNRLSQYGHPSWMHSFALNNKQYVQAVRWESVLRAGGRPPTRATFDRIRMASSAVLPCLDMVGMFLANGSPTDLMDCLYVQQLSVMTAYIVSHMNDLYSFNKEFQDGTMDNIVMVLRQERNLEWPEAVDCAIELVNEEVAGFLDLESELERLRNPLDSDTLEYIAGMKSWIISNLAWSAESGRYKKYNSSWNSSESKG